MRPHGTVFYFGIAVFASVVGSMFAWGVFAFDGAPFSWRLARTAVAMVFLFGAVQSFEGLFRPETAGKRSGALSGSTRLRLRTACRSILALSATMIAIAAILRLAGGQYKREFSTDLQVLSGVLFFAGYCIADLSGERFSALFRAH